MEPHRGCLRQRVPPGDAQRPPGGRRRAQLDRPGFFGMRADGRDPGGGAPGRRGREGRQATDGQSRRLAPVRGYPARGAAQAAERDLSQVFPREASSAVVASQREFRAPGVFGRDGRCRSRRDRADGARAGLRVPHAREARGGRRRDPRRVRPNALRRARRRQVPGQGINREDAGEEGGSIAARARAAVDEPAQRRRRRQVRRAGRRDAADDPQVPTGRDSPVYRVGGFDDFGRGGESGVRPRRVPRPRGVPGLPHPQAAGQEGRRPVPERGLGRAGDERVRESRVGGCVRRRGSANAREHRVGDVAGGVADPGHAARAALAPQARGEPVSGGPGAVEQAREAGGGCQGGFREGVWDGGGGGGGGQPGVQEAENGGFRARGARKRGGSGGGRGGPEGEKGQEGEEGEKGEKVAAVRSCWSTQ
mmetsp:Transcript_5294/g.21638  ORF Transcript_5294/g.21638 Transcript_5294/m.21638 type:complete len:422 (-) Transcript_5294:1510-2775(-)